MNEPIPPSTTLPVLPAVSPTLGKDPEDRVAIPHSFAAIEAILRQPRRVLYQLRQPDAGSLMGKMCLITIVCSLLYGVVVGTFSMGVQIWAAPVKIAGGLIFSAVICLPSLYIFACLSGSKARLSEICGLVLGLLTLTTLLLLGFAPVAWLFSQSTESVAFMGGLHLLLWTIAAFFGLRFLQNGFSHSEARSQAGLQTWIVIFVLVVVQMTTALRPLVGTSNTIFPTEKKCFLSHWVDCMNESQKTVR
jgi:hypothetical protein